MLAGHSSVEGGLLPKMVELWGFSRGKASLGEFTPLCFYCFSGREIPPSSCFPIAWIHMLPISYHLAEGGMWGQRGH